MESVHSVGFTTDKKMSTLDAWHYITNNWMCSTWQALPEQVKHALHLHSSLGMYAGTLVTRSGSLGMIEYVYRMNHKELIKQEGMK